MRGADVPRWARVFELEHLVILSKSKKSMFGEKHMFWDNLGFNNGSVLMGLSTD